MGYETGEHGDDGWDSLPTEWGIVIIAGMCIIAGAFVAAGTYIFEQARRLYLKVIPPLFTLL